MIKIMRYQFVESSLFTKMVYDYLSESDYIALQQFHLEHPDAGDEVKGSGGVRKLRWGREGTGKSGGVRVCYFVRSAAGQILLLVIYAKSVRTSIPAAVLKHDSSSELSSESSSVLGVLLFVSCEFFT
jgi:hypothetical protein